MGKLLIMILRFSKIRLFLLLAVLFVGPLVGYKIVWLLRSHRVAGVYSYRGMGSAGDQISLDYSVCWFPLGHDTIWFNGTGNLGLREGDTIPVRYSPDEPWDARIDVFPAIWGDTIVYGGIPLFILLALFIHPGVVPRGRRVRLVRQRPYLLLE
jgi:hypothetical protein